MKKILLSLLIFIHIPMHGMDLLFSATQQLVQPIISVAETVFQKAISETLDKILLSNINISSSNQRFIETAKIYDHFFLKIDKPSKTAIVSLRIRSSDEVVRLTAEQRLAARKLFNVIAISVKSLI